MKYYARIPNSVIHVMVKRGDTAICEEARFSGAMLDTEDNSVRDELLNAACENYLSAIANRPGSGISTSSAEDVDAAVIAEKEADIRRLAEEAHRKLTAAGIRP